MLQELCAIHATMVVEDAHDYFSRSMYCRIQKMCLPALVSGLYTVFLVRTPLKAAKKAFLIII